MFRNTRRCLQVFLTVFTILVFHGALEAQVSSGPSSRHRRDETVLRQGVHILGERTLEALTYVSEDGSTLVFARPIRQLRRIMGGDVIVCGVSGKTPYGMLRRVVDISRVGGRIELRTEPATLEDVFWTGRARETLRMSVADVTRVTGQMRGVRVRGFSSELQGAGPAEEDWMAGEVTARDVTWSPRPIEIEFLQVVLFDLDEDPMTTDDQVRLSGKAGVAPTFDIDLDISWGQVRKFSFTNTNELYNKLELEGRLFVPLLDESFTVATLQFNPVVVWAGPVPLVFIPILDIKAGVLGSLTAEVRTSVTVGVLVTAGVIYENQQWRGFTDFPDSLEDIRLDWQPPQLVVDTYAQAYAGPKFSFLLYGVVGPFASVYGYTDLSAMLLPEPSWVLSVGVRGSIGLASTVPIIGPNYTLPVFNQKWKVAEGALSPF